MLRRTVGGFTLALLALLLASTPASAQRSVTFSIGAFDLRGENSRVAGDVLVTNQQYLAFDIKDFKGLTFGAEWTAGLGEFLEAGIGVGYYQHRVPSVYYDWVNSNGSEIVQGLDLRIVPLSATVRILPFGKHNPIQPYVGGGFAVYFWRYEEDGQFVDFKDNSIFTGSYVGTGTAIGPVVVAGLRAQAARQIDIGFEFREQWGQGDLPAGFLDNKIDLGGYSLLGTLRYRF